MEGDVTLMLDLSSVIHQPGDVTTWDAAVFQAGALYVKITENEQFEPFKIIRNERRFTI